MGLIVYSLQASADIGGGSAVIKGLITKVFQTINLTAEIFDIFNDC